MFLRVLLVDDNVSLLAQAVLFLEEENENFDIELANSAREALEHINTTDFDIIVCDYDMPGMNGLDFLQTLRSRGNNVPFILFSEKQRDEIAMKALQLGANRYLQKGGSRKAEFGVLTQAITTEVERQRSKKRSQKLHSLLNITREINQLIARASTLGEFFQKTTTKFLHTKGYLGVLIGLIDNPNTLTVITHKGSFKRVQWECTPKKRDSFGKCMKEVIESKKPKHITSVQAYCKECGFCHNPPDPESQIVIIPLSREDSLTGVLLTRFEKDYEISVQEKRLLEEIGENLILTWKKIENNKKLRTQKERLYHLHSWAQKLYKTHKIGEIFKYTLKAIEELLGDYYVTILLKKDNTLKLEQYKGYTPPKSRRQLSLDDRTIIMDAINERKAIIINDQTNHPEYIPASKPIKSELILPIIIEDGRTGVIVIGGQEKNAFDQNDAEFMELLSSYISIALEKI